MCVHHFPACAVVLGFADAIVGVNKNNALINATVTRRNIVVDPAVSRASGLSADAHTSHRGAYGGTTPTCNSPSRIRERGRRGDRFRGNRWSDDRLSARASRSRVEHFLQLSSSHLLL
jgi:hypothetical protein